MVSHLNNGFWTCIVWWFQSVFMKMKTQSRLQYVQVKTVLHFLSAWNFYQEHVTFVSLNKSWHMVQNHFSHIHREMLEVPWLVCKATFQKLLESSLGLKSGSKGFVSRTILQCLLKWHLQLPIGFNGIYNRGLDRYD